MVGVTDVAPGRPLAELLESFSLKREDFEELMRAALEEASVERFAPITTREQKILIEDSGLGERGMQALRSGMERGAEVVAADDEALERARLAGGSVPMGQAAELLNRSVSAMSRGVTEGRLVAFRLNERVRYPLWQFHEGQPLPGLARVTAALPAAWRPRKVMAVMTAPAQSLDDLSPVQWLAEAGDPKQVVQLIEDLDRG